MTAEEKSLCRHLPRPTEDALVGVVTAKLWGAIRSGGQPFVIFQGREVTFSRLGAALTGWRFACKKIAKMASFASYSKVVLWCKCMFFFLGGGSYISFKMYICLRGGLRCMCVCVSVYTQTYTCICIQTHTGLTCNLCLCSSVFVSLTSLFRAHM